MTATGSRRAGAGHARRRHRSRPAIWSWALPMVMVALAGAVPLLVWYAADAIFRSTDGELTERVTDPAAPGYEVAVIASPSHLILGLDPAGALATVALASLGADDRGGTVLLIPAEAIVERDLRLVDVHADGGEDAVRAAVGTLTDIDVDAVTVLDAEGWEVLVGPAGALTVEITEDLVTVDEATGSETTVWNAGATTVEPAQASAFIGWLNEGEDPFNRVLRQQRFWESWLAVVGASTDPGIVPGETDNGIGRFVPGIAHDPMVVHASVTSARTEGGPGFRIDIDELRTTVTGMIPFPLPTEPGARPRVRLLDGVGGLDLATDFAPALVRSGAQIVILGNSLTFGADTTAVIHHDERFAEQAATFADAIGATEVRLEDLEEPVVDVTIIIGEDARP